MGPENRDWSKPQEINSIDDLSAFYNSEQGEPSSKKLKARLIIQGKGADAQLVARKLTFRERLAAKMGFGNANFRKVTAFIKQRFASNVQSQNQTINEIQIENFRKSIQKYNEHHLRKIKDIETLFEALKLGEPSSNARADIITAGDSSLPPASPRSAKAAIPAHKGNHATVPLPLETQRANQRNELYRLFQEKNVEKLSERLTEYPPGTVCLPFLESISQTVQGKKLISEVIRKAYEEVNVSLLKLFFSGNSPEFLSQEEFLQIEIKLSSESYISVLENQELSSKCKENILNVFCYNAQDPQTQETPLMVAVRSGKIHAMEQLMQQVHCDRRLTNSTGQTAFHVAIDHQQWQCVEKFINDSQTFYWFQKDSQGRTPYECLDAGELKIKMRGKLLDKMESLRFQQLRTEIIAIFTREKDQEALQILRNE